MIFARFMAIYGHKFKSCFETEEEIRIAKREWALSLEGYSEAELVAAVDRCKETLAWMPAIAEFLALLSQVRGGDGLPSAREAYVEACLHADHPLEHGWSHDAVYRAGRETGWFALRSEEETLVFPRFRYVYEQLCQRVRAGETLEGVVPAKQALADQRDTSTALFIQEYGRQQGLEPELAATLLYYLTLPQGSRTRERFRQRAQAQVDALGLGIELPTDTSMGLTFGAEG